MGREVNNRAVIFDVDGVMIHTAPQHFVAQVIRLLLDSDKVGNYR
jgi:beta-phosphoglucomutase-like phosphatase (HAD superfamily)